MRAGGMSYGGTDGPKKRTGLTDGRMYRTSGRAGPTDLRTDNKQYDDDVDCDDDHEGDSDDADEVRSVH